jgi:hypothetical protein
MRFMIALLFVLVSACNEKMASSKQQPAVADTQYDGYSVDVEELDLLDVVLDVPIEVSGDKIFFKSTEREVAVGAHSTCESTFTMGENYDYQLNGSVLTLTKSNGEKFDLKRISGEGADLVGAWKGTTLKGHQSIMQRFTILSENRLIVRTHCEG